jgi:hypothetical protein
MDAQARRINGLRATAHLRAHTTGERQLAAQVRHGPPPTAHQASLLAERRILHYRVERQEPSGIAAAYNF